MDCSKALSSFNTYRANFEIFIAEPISESDTRSKIIDCIMKDVLGWEESCIEREGYVQKQGYFDYVLSVNGFKFVVEAKKDRVDFSLPTQHRRVVPLSTLYKQNREVIEQIRDYISGLSLSSGVITNGRQVIIAQFVNTNGDNWLNNDAYYFDGFDDIHDHFIDFWNMLSFTSVSSNRRITKVGKKIDFCKSIISSIPAKNSEITRNQLAVAITPIIDLVFRSLYHSNTDEDDIGFIKQCYVDSLETNKNQQHINSIFSDDSPRLKEVLDIKNRKLIAKELSREISKDKFAINTPKPIIIIGTKGAGKSTFINHYFRSDKSQECLSTHPYAIVDMMNYYSSEPTINKKKILEDVILKIDTSYPELKIEEYSTYEQIYKGEIEKKKKGIWAPYVHDIQTYRSKVANFIEEKRNDSESHIIALNSFLIENKAMRIIVAFDNADQLNDDIQSELFLFAGSLNSRGRMGVIISLREGYYHKFKNKNPFNAYQSNVYHIAVPNYADVLKKRIEYSIELVKDSDTIEDISGIVEGKNIKLSVDSIVSFFEALATSTFIDDNSGILEFIKQTTFPNIREGLKVYSLFLTSGYSDIFKYIYWIYKDGENSKMIVPFHEFVQAVGLENKLYYNAEASQIINLFKSPLVGDYFTPIVILRYLYKEAIINSSSLVVFKNMLESFMEYGYSEKEIKLCVGDLIDKELVKTSDEISDTQRSLLDIDSQNFRTIAITSKGAYYINELLNTFCYLDLVLQDTNIYDDTTYSELKRLFPLRDHEHNRDMDKRIDFMKRFLEYLRLEENQHVPNSIIKEYGSIINDIYNKGLTADIERININLEKLKNN